MNFDLLSFLAGIFSGFALWGLRSLLKSLIPAIRDFASRWLTHYTSNTLLAIEEKVRSEAFQRAQTMHVASSLFSLDDILIPPKVISKPKNSLNHRNLPIYSPTDDLFPFTPGYVELASQFPVTKISLKEASENGANCVLIGTDGSGKTTALADLIVQIIRDEKESGTFHLFPVYLHVHDIDLEQEANDFSDVLIRAFALRNPSVEFSQIERLFHHIQALDNRRFILILDGFDELLPENSVLYTKFIRNILSILPGIQIITTASPEFLGELPELGFSPLALACWDEKDKYNFISKWKSGWTKQVNEKDDNQYSLAWQHSLIANWILREKKFLNPLDWSLIAWAGYAGDSMGPTPVHALEAYINRVIQKSIPRSVVEQIAGLLLDKRILAIQLSDLEKVIAQHKPQQIENDKFRFLQQSNETSHDRKRGKSGKEKRITSRDQAIQSLLSSGLMVEYNHERFGFKCQSILGYLASFLDIPDAQISNSSQKWIGYHSTLRYYAAQNKHTELICEYAELSKPPLFQKLVSVGRYLDTPQRYKWRDQIFERLGYLLAVADLPDFQMFQITSALLTSNDPSLSLLFNQLLKSPKAATRSVAALAVAALGMQNSTNLLVNLLEDHDEKVKNSAAMAISQLDNPFALQIQEEILHHADETQRMIVAESIAVTAGGMEKINTCLESEDMLIRRAALAGLAKINSIDIVPIVERIYHEDRQWIIRSLAQEILERIQSPNTPYSPEPITWAGESAWLIEYASQIGQGISPEILPYDVLMHAVQNGEIDQQKAAMEYLSLIRDPAINELYETIINDLGNEIRDEAAYHLWLQTCKTE